MRYVCLTAGVLLALSIGCEPDTLGGVDRDRPLIALSASESADLCSALAQRFDEAEQDPVIKRGVCVYNASRRAKLEAQQTGADELALCEQQRTQCLEGPIALGFECRQAFPTCPNRVVDIDRCVWLALETLRVVADTQCGDPSEPMLSIPPGWPTEQDCTRLHALCFPALDH